MKFSIFRAASVDIRALPGAWVAELLDVVLRGPGSIKDQVSRVEYIKRLKLNFYAYLR